MRLARILVLVIFLLVGGCQLSVCPHDLTRNVYVKKNEEAMYRNAVCRACGAVVVSLTYTHPYKGPPEGFHGDDTLIQIQVGGWDQEQLEEGK